MRYRLAWHSLLTLMHCKTPNLRESQYWQHCMHAAWLRMLTINLRPHTGMSSSKQALPILPFEITAMILAAALGAQRLSNCHFVVFYQLSPEGELEEEVFYTFSAALDCYMQKTSDGGSAAIYKRCGDTYQWASEHYLNSTFPKFVDNIVALTSPWAKLKPLL